MKKLLTLVLFIFSLSLYSQVEVKYFNAGWNKANDIEWVSKLSDCELEKFDIGTDL